jgi:hypothetical protein
MLDPGRAVPGPRTGPSALMHSMVRFNVLTAAITGTSRPMASRFRRSTRCRQPSCRAFCWLKRRCAEVVRHSRPPSGRLEVARYRGFLLGLPRELLADTPRSVVDITLTRFATLRKGFDDTCAALIAATMAADLTPDDAVSSRVHAWMERGFAKLFFVACSMRGDKHAAAGVGVRLGLADYLGAAAASILIGSRMSAYAIAAHIPVIGGEADRALVRKLSTQLVRYGHAEFTTNAHAYRPAHT